MRLKMCGVMWCFYCLRCLKIWTCCTCLRPESVRPLWNNKEEWRERDAVPLSPASVVVIFATAGDSVASDAAGATEPACPCFSIQGPRGRTLSAECEGSHADTCPTPSAWLFNKAVFFFFWWGKAGNAHVGTLNVCVYTTGFVRYTLLAKQNPHCGSFFFFFFFLCEGFPPVGLCCHCHWADCLSKVETCMLIRNVREKLVDKLLLFANFIHCVRETLKIFIVTTIIIINIT